MNFMLKKAKKQKHDFFQVYGINGVHNIIQSKRVNIIRVDIMVGGKAEKQSQFVKLFQNRAFPIHHIPKVQFLQQYSGKRTQGIVITFMVEILKKLPSFMKTRNNNCLLAMDNVEDPQNLGQIIRTSECAGIDGILIPRHGSVQTTNTVLQVSQGAFMHIPLYNCGNLHQELRKLKTQGFWIVGAENSIKSKYWHELDYKRKLVLVMGSEGKGIRPVIRKICDDLITIPMNGTINSLNVSAAVSALLFERQRQMLQAVTN